MGKVVGVHRLALKPGVEAANFEEFVRKEVFPGLGVVIHGADKSFSHGLTAAHWLASRHMLLRNTGDDAGGNYLWVIVADVDDEQVSTPEGRAAVGKEVQAKAQEFFDSGSGLASIASVKLTPFATRTSFETFLEACNFAFGSSSPSSPS
jgi:hypothetical protein